MARIPTFANDDPIISNVPVDSGAKGNFAIANMVGRVSNKFVGHMLEARRATSNAALFSQNAVINNAKRDAMTQIQLNPENAATIENNFRSHIDQINKNVELMDEDKKKLTVLSQNAVDLVSNHALLASGRQARITQNVNFRNDFPNTLKSIAQQLYDDPAAAKAQIETTHKLIGDGLLHGYITNAEAQNANSAINSLLERHAQLATYISNGGSQPHHLHAMSSMPGDTNKQITSQADTAFHYGIINQNVTYDDAISKLHKGIIDGGVISSLSPVNFQKYLMSMEGINKAQGLINSGVHYNLLKKQFNMLNMQPASLLSESEKAERDQLSFYIKNIDNGNLLQAMEKTSTGANIFSNYTDNINSITHNNALSALEKQKEMNNQFTDLTNNVVAYAHTHGIPTDKINPIPQTLATNLDDAYNSNLDPQRIIQMMDQYNRRNGVYLANSIKSDVQKESLNIVNNLRGKKENPFLHDLITATSRQMDFSDLKPAAGITDNTIKQDILNDNPDLFSYLRSQPNGTQRVANILTASTRYVKYQGQKNNDLTLDHIRDYEKTFRDAYKKSITLDTASNFNIDSEKIGTTHAQNRALADYLIQKTKTDMQANADRSMISSMLDLSPLRLISTEDGNLMVMNDRNSQIGRKYLYTSELMAKAAGWEKVLTDKEWLKFPGNGLELEKEWQKYHPKREIDEGDLSEAQGEKR